MATLFWDDFEGLGPQRSLPKWQRSCHCEPFGAAARCVRGREANSVGDPGPIPARTPWEVGGAPPPGRGSNYFWPPGQGQEAGRALKEQTRSLEKRPQATFHFTIREGILDGGLASRHDVTEE